MKKKIILSAALLALMSGTTYASVIDNPNDSAYIEKTVAANNEKAKSESLQLANLEKKFPCKDFTCR